MIDLDKKQDNNATPSKEEIERYVQSVYDYAANALVQNNYDNERTKRQLIEQGLREEDAEVVISNIREKVQEAQEKNEDSGNKRCLYGLLWAFGGAFLTFVSDGTLIFYGAIIYGLYLIGTGMVSKD